MGKREARLSDLFRRGTKHTFTDPDGGMSVTVYVRKLRDHEMDKVYAAASAARARELARYRDPDGDYMADVTQQVYELGDDPGPLAAFLAGHQVSGRVEAIEAEIAGAEDSEWAKDDYLNGLREAWFGSDETRPLREVYAIVESVEDWRNEADDEDLTEELVDEARRVYAEFNRFNTQVQERAAAELEAAKAYFEADPIERLRDLVAKQFIDDAGRIAWTRGYRLARILHSVRRDDDHSKKYFHHIDEVEDLDPSIRAELVAVYDLISTAGTVGKDSPLPPSSLERSDSHDTPGGSGHSSVASVA